MRITWIGHSTVLVELDGVRVLTDPVLRPRITHLRRVGQPADLSLLRELDAVVISHAHYDHLDLGSLRRIDRSVQYVVPRGVGAVLGRNGFTRVVELEPDEETRVGSLTIRATHADHDGGSFRRHAASLGYLLAGSATAYFAGDTDLFDAMSGLEPDLDVALVPVAGWGSRVPAGHLDPLRAAQAVQRLRPRHAVPIHWGTYRRVGLSSDPVALREPAESFARLAAELAPGVAVQILPVGGTAELAGSLAPAATDTNNGARP